MRDSRSEVQIFRDFGVLLHLVVFHLLVWFELIRPILGLIVDGRDGESDGGVH